VPSGNNFDTFEKILEMKRKKRDQTYVEALLKFLFILLLLFFSKRILKVRDEDKAIKLTPVVEKPASKLADISW
jgi:hypothetical protein